MKHRGPYGRVYFVRLAGVFLLLAVAVGFAYHNALQGQFVFDDYHHLVEHPLVPRIAAEPTLLLSPEALGFRPVRTLSYALDFAIGGMDPWVFHASNVVYHWLTACFVFLVAMQLTNARRPSATSEGGYGAAPRWRAAMFVALLWALHPVQTEAVAYLSGRHDILGGLGLFAGLWAYLRFRTSTARGWLRYGWLLGAAGAYGFGVLSKESVLVLPALCWLTDVMVLGDGLGEALRRRWVAYAGVLLLGGVLLWLLAGSTIDFWIVRDAWYGGSVVGNFATVTRIWSHYLWLMIWPGTLIADYSFNAFPESRSFAEPEVLLSLGVLALAALAAWLLARRWRLIGYGACWIVICLLPASHIIPIREILAEHYLYVAVFGLALIAGVLLDAACGSATAPAGAFARWRAVLGHAAMGVVLGAALVRTTDRNEDWRDEKTLWEATVLAAPECARAHYSLGGVYFRAKRFEDAQREFTTALTIVPAYTDAMAGLGEIALKTGSPGFAWFYAKQAEKMGPSAFRVQFLLGVSAAHLGKFDEAEKYLLAARQVRPWDIEPYKGLEFVAEAKGDATSAARWRRQLQTLEASAGG